MAMISKEEVLNLATLARLKLSEQEVESLQKDISNILDYVGQVSAVSIGKEKEKPLQRNVMRADTVRGADDAMAGKEEALRGAFPKREGDFNLVRKIIQKDE
jgi:aspartyl-tRNA(Asn)/glutamyl-tRNA(Gln) amidotransferase subunit C